MLLVDWQIEARCTEDPPLLDPFSDAVEDGVVSYGLNATGYDLRLNTQIKVFKGTRNWVVDPKNIDPDMFDVYEVALGEPLMLPGHTYALVQSLEYIRMPRDLEAYCVGKSTWARCGLIVNTTPADPGWEGNLTVEVANTSPLPLRLYTGEGIAQMKFQLLAGDVRVSYRDKGGKYMYQKEVTPARMK